MLNRKIREVVKHLEESLLIELQMKRLIPYMGYNSAHTHYLLAAEWQHHISWAAWVAQEVNSLSKS